MTIEIVFAFVIGCVIGALSNRKDKDVEEQKAIYDKKIIQYEIDIASVSYTHLRAHET